VKAWPDRISTLLKRYRQACAAVYLSPAWCLVECCLADAKLDGSSLFELDVKSRPWLIAGC
jgi:hypothetical protein